MSSSENQRPHVLILGAGLGGLLLAQCLRKQGISFQIFEKDEGLHTRFQGWAIALYTVLQDLKQSVPDDLPPIATTSHFRPLDLPPEFIMYARDGSRHALLDIKENDVLRANRSELRRWLATKVDVQWNMTVTAIDDDAKKVTLHFADGTHATGDVLVGCDGVHSTVRAHLFPGEDLLQVAPFGNVTGEVTLNKEQYERQMSHGRSAYVVPGSDCNLFCGLNSIAPDTETARYYWTVMWMDSAASHGPYWTAHASKQECYDAALKKTRDLDEKFTELIRATKVEDMMVPPLIHRDMLLRELPEGRRVTLVGDASHPMLPHLGQGGNNAMQDALNLARMLSKSNANDVALHIKAYQDEMLARSAVSVKASRQAAEDRVTEKYRHHDKYGSQTLIAQH
ncbi:MAG: hypothetical protein M1822_009450 [Bathelium mastoideum]|nr:MAG: hypothetical protein M1822_009450 [Bathelium mastoideum]